MNSSRAENVYNDRVVDPGSERPLDMPRACEEVCPTGAILSGSMAELAPKNRQKVARKLSASKMPGFPGIVVDGHNTFGQGETE